MRSNHRHFVSSIPQQLRLGLPQASVVGGQGEGFCYLRHVDMKLY